MILIEIEVNLLKINVVFLFYLWYILITENIWNIMDNSILFGDWTQAIPKVLPFWHNLIFSHKIITKILLFFYLKIQSNKVNRLPWVDHFVIRM